MIKKLGVTAFFLFCLSSCYTIHFKRTGRLANNYQITQWHHIGLFGLMEFSPPVNLKVCPRDSWMAVRTQIGFLQGLVTNIQFPRGGSTPVPDTDISIPNTISVGTFYSPEEVAIACSQ